MSLYSYSNGERKSFSFSQAEYVQAIEDIKKLIFSIEGKPYLNTTQNLNYITGLSRGINTAFTITGGGDSIFSLANAGAKKIIAADINPFSRAVFSLKNAAFEYLSYDDFVSFLFNAGSSDFLSRRLFMDKVYEKYGAEYYYDAEFWNGIFSIHGFSAYYLFLFHTGLEHSLNPQKFIPYLKNRAAYEETREKMKSAEVIICQDDAVKTLESLKDEQCDWIDISNILLFVFLFGCNKNLVLFRRYLERLYQAVKGSLNKDGVFVIDYVFDCEDPRELLGVRSQVPGMSKGDRSVELEIYRYIYKTINELFNVESISYPTSGSMISSGSTRRFSGRDCVVKAKSRLR